MSNPFNIFRRNNRDSDSDEENSQEESLTTSISQPGRELDEVNIVSQQYLEGRRQRRRIQQPTTQLNTPPTVGSTSQFIIPSINNEVEANLGATEENLEQNLTTQLQELNTNQTIIVDNTEQQITAMNAQQFNQLLTALGQLTNQLGQQQQQQQQQQPQQPQQGGGGGNVPRIAVQIPIFKGEPRENVSAWLMQVETIFAAQGIDDAATRCYYASTGMKEAALH